MSERSDRLDELFHQALTKTKEGRALFLAEACGGDKSLRQELQSMVDALERAGGFMEMPALELTARMAGDAGSRSCPLTRVPILTFLLTAGRSSMCRLTTPAAIRCWWKTSDES